MTELLSEDRPTLLTVLDRLLSALETRDIDAFVQWSGTDAEGETVVERWPLCGDR